jgi:hypothetical protein
MLLLGAINRPYATMQKVADTGTPWPAIWLVGVVSNVVMGIFAYLAGTRGAFPTSGATLAAVYAVLLVTGTYLAAASVVALVCGLVGGNGNLRRHVSTWALTYPPTILAFLANLLMHIIAATPGFTAFASLRTNWLFTIFLALLVMALLWKLVLYFTYLRVVGELNFRQIVPASVLLFMAAVVYEWIVVALNLSKMPFI